MSNDFYLRYYVGHKGMFGHEFLEFEFRPDGKLRYANNSNYKNDTMIRKEAYVHSAVMDELRRVIEDSEVSVWLNTHVYVALRTAVQIPESDQMCSQIIVVKKVKTILKIRDYRHQVTLSLSKRFFNKYHYR